MENANLPREEITSNMDTSVDIQVLVTSMREKVDNLSPLSPKCCIFRVPKRLRQLNERVYTPVKVSIGPLHHGKDDLKPMEEHKWRYLKDFLQHSKKPLEYLVKFIKKKEKKIRQHYAETINFNSDKFVKIILVDAAFIIEVLLKHRGLVSTTSGDPMFGKSEMILDTYQDFLVLENQLPFFVLNKLFKMIVLDRHESNPGIIRLFFNLLPLFNGLTDLNPNDIVPIRGDHFVDLVSSFLTPGEDSQLHQWKNGFVKSPNATELHNAGIKFQVSSSKNLFDIKFMSGVLEIPKFVIAYGTEVWLRNLLAFERCMDNERYMTQYVWFLDNLIDSSKDAEYLVESGVIENWIGDNNDVSNLINKVSMETWLNDLDNFFFSELIDELNDYCKIPWHNWKATLRRDYFKTPWRVISIVAAAILLSLTVIQTVCSIVSVGKATVGAMHGLLPMV